MNQIPLCRCSYGPVCARDGAHLQGRELSPAPGLRDHDAPRARHARRRSAMAQDALDRWWWPSLMMFGPSDDDSKHSAQSMRWKIKRFSNDELRQKFVDIDRAAGGFPRAQGAGSRTALGRARRSTTASARSTGANSSRCCKGNGPCNRERLEARRQRARGRSLGARGRDGLGGKAGGRRQRARPERRGQSMSHDSEAGLAAVRGLHPRKLRPRPQARRQPARDGCAHGARARARRVHAPPGRRQHLGRPLRATSSPPTRRMRTRCSSRRRTRSTATRRSTTSRTR